MSRLQTSFVLGYHGCEKSLGLKAIQGDVDLLQSTRDFDWLGHGIYFWENDPKRAKEWADQKKTRGDYQDPFVIGAAIDLGNCLDLCARENLDLVRSAADSFMIVRKKSGLPMPVNKAAPKDSSPDLVMRYLDCAVMTHLHMIIEETGLESFDSVRGLFPEGGELYSGSGLRDKTHIQIAVCNPRCIKGVFLPR